MILSLEGSLAEEVRSHFKWYFKLTMCIVTFLYISFGCAGYLVSIAFLLLYVLLHFCLIFPHTVVLFTLLMKTPERSCTSRVPFLYSPFAMMDWHTYTHIKTDRINHIASCNIMRSYDVTTSCWRHMTSWRHAMMSWHHTIGQETVWYH